MKKLLSLLLAAILVLSLAAESALAAPSGRGRDFADPGRNGVCGGYLDEDGDGICDNCPGGRLRPRDGAGRGAGRRGAYPGASFLDEDGDRVCDNCAGGRLRPRDGAGARRGRNG